MRRPLALGPDRPHPGRQTEETTIMEMLDSLTATLANLMSPPDGIDFDSSSPPAEAALTAPGPVSWRIFKNPVAL